MKILRKATLGYFACFVILFTVPFRFVRADDYDEYVREVLEEDQEHYGDDQNYYYEDSDFDDIQRRKDDAQKQKQLEEERLAREQAELVAAERERSFQAELLRMNADQQKAAMRQKKKDAKIVRSVLKAANRDDHYSVLGIRNWDVKVPERKFNIWGLRFRIPGFTVKTTTTQDIRRAYRSRAVSVHPDKNRDGRAQEAFIAVENAASILSDERLRLEYDKEARRIQRRRREESIGLVVNFLSCLQRTMSQFFKAIHTVSGPFATPVIIIAALII